MPGTTTRRLRSAVAALAIAVSLVAAAGAGPEPARAATCRVSQVDVVAHPDDDLLFQSPDLATAVAKGVCVTTAYLTAGDGGHDTTYWQRRALGLEAAYARMAGVADEWTPGTMRLAGRTVTTAVLTADPRITLVFFLLPDGGLKASGFRRTGHESLPRLDQGRIRTITSIDGSGTTYTRSQLVASIRALLVASAATRVHTLDYSGTWADASKDHPDHRAVGYLTRAASKRYAARHTLTAYVGYPTSLRKADVSGRALAAKSAAFYAYARFDGDLCQTPKTCAGGYEAAWLKRQYVADSRTVGAAARP